MNRISAKLPCDSEISGGLIKIEVRLVSGRTAIVKTMPAFGRAGIIAYYPAGLQSVNL
jgi:hypothetical protein